MIKIKKEGILLKKTFRCFENQGVLNPAVIKDKNEIHMFYRAVNNEHYSSIGYCKLSDPGTVIQRMETPVLFPEFDYESRGVEDPRIVKIDQIYYLSYCAFDGVNALGALAVSKDLKNWEKFGIIVPRIRYSEFVNLAETTNRINEKYFRFNKLGRSKRSKGKDVLVWDKNVVFFPRRIQGKICFLHRIKPDIQLVRVNEVMDLNRNFWRNYLLHFQESVVITSKYAHEVSYVGAGCPPIETSEGWLLIYHGVYDTIEGYVYTVCAALLNLDDPAIEIARLPYPLLEPDKDWELKGIVNNVCFPSGALVIEDNLIIYYGAADEQIAYGSVSLSGLLKELMLNRVS